MAGGKWGCCHTANVRRRIQRKKETNKQNNSRGRCWAWQVRYQWRHVLPDQSRIWLQAPGSWLQDLLWVDSRGSGDGSCHPRGGLRIRCWLPSLALVQLRPLQAFGDQQWAFLSLSLISFVCAYTLSKNKQAKPTPFLILLRAVWQQCPCQEERPRSHPRAACRLMHKDVWGNSMHNI